MQNETTDDPWWALSLNDGPLLALSSEEEAIENWLEAEYGCGWSAIIYRPECSGTPMTGQTTPATCPECGCRNGWHVAQCRTGNAALDVKREKVASALFEFVYEGTGDDYRDFAARLWSELPYEKRRLWYRQADIALAAIGDQPHVE